MTFSTNALRLAAALLAVAAGACTNTASPNCGAFCPCTADTDCSGTTPRCDTKGGSCVPCLPQKDNCPSGQRCVASGASYACTSTCTTSADCATDAGAARACCSGMCADLTADVANCGACGTVCDPKVGAEAACTAGKCVLGACHPPMLNCNNDPADGCEVNKSNDPLNCGICANACPTGANSQSACVNGTCSPLLCSSPFQDCNGMSGDGCETNIKTDAMNCGKCASTCAVKNATSSCSGGTCSFVCLGSFADCNGLTADGCEADLAADSANCAACKTPCPVLANQVSACLAGSCQPAVCRKGFADCNRVQADGCEVDTTSDPINCSACGVGCPAPLNTTATCTDGACGFTCLPGWSNCNGLKDDGCEIHFTVDRLNCGACGAKCPPADQSEGACNMGACGAGGACDPGFGDCNMLQVDGCEHPLTDDMNCGGCGVACVAPHATAKCVASACALQTCSAGWADCDTLEANGCEQDTDNDPNNCGACGHVCSLPNATAGCAKGQCTVASCAAGHGDCDGVAKNGCEGDVKSDPLHCGACGIVCPFVFPACSEGLCTDHYQPDGVQTDIPLGWLGNWNQCFIDTYADIDSLDTLLNTSCQRANLLIACRPAGSKTLTVVAQAPRGDVTWETGLADNVTTHAKNQVGFYYDADWSWGVVPFGDLVRKLPCDGEMMAEPAQRMCWATENRNLVPTVLGIMGPPGRCGTTVGIGDKGWERIVYDAN